MQHVTPLDWPVTFPRTRFPERGRFKVDVHTAARNVERSLRLFGRDSRKPVTNAAISYTRGQRSARALEAGAAVWFVWDGEERCIPVDRFDSIAANLQAIHKIIEARRTELRLGTLHLVKATFSGFKALPKQKTWRQILGFPESYTPDPMQLKVRWHELVKRHHPDHGGSVARMAEINAARDAAIKELGL